MTLQSMISAVRICSKCGWEIPADAPEGGCPGCLLESGLRLLEVEAVAERADLGHIDKSARAGTRSERFAELLGELGDYELLEEVGRGGQGVVFRARQKNLNRIVALKVISLGQWASKEHLKRFRREAEAAAKLEHPGIVPIHDVGERDGSCYFSMKFVEGGQLDEVVKRAPMSIRQAAEFVAKVARTVHYAHEHGILHRDIKPGNILLDEKGEPHLTDFGLARLLDTQSSVTRTIDVLGTPSYMAPEQAAGDTRKLSKATDVYGLGAVLYQLLTGQPPFAGGTTYETIRLLRDTEPKPPRSLNSKIDHDLSTICLKCLEKDPERRYSSALALAEDLEHWLKHEPIQAKPSGLLTHARKWVRRNPSTTVLVSLLIALAVGLSVTVWNRKPKVVIPKSVAVLPFQNLSDDKENAYFADAIQEEILTRLAGIGDLKVISRSSTQRYHSKPANLAQIAKQLGVANIVEGSVQKVSDQIRVNVQLINAQTDSHLWADTFDRKLTDVFGVESEIAKRIAESLQAKLSGREQQALAVKPTNNPEAYDAYLRGLSFEARSAPFPSSEARAFYDRAVQLDPKFAIAWSRLSRAEALLYRRDDEHRPPVTHAEAAKTAWENAQKLAPDSAESLLALGYYQYWVLEDFEAAKVTFGRVGNMLPGSSEAPYALGRVMRAERRWAESIPYFEQALALDPRNVELLYAAGVTYASLKQFSAALKLFDRALDIKPNDPNMMASKARIYQAQGNLQEAAKLLSGINETSSGVAFETKTSQLQFERNFVELVRLQQARLTQDGSDFGDQLNLAIYQRLAGDMAGAKVTAEQVRNTLEPLYRDKPDNPGYATGLAEAYAFMGEKDLALQLADRVGVLTNDVNGPSQQEFQALIRTIVGDNSRAISALTQLSKIPYVTNFYIPTGVTPALLRIDPMWDPLRSDPRFQELCKEKMDKSIAVLPFENLSADPNNAYFAEGIQDEIVTQLAKIADLRVISRASTQRYQSKPRDLGEIAKQLGVANILEGSVQKAADQARVNVKLISAETDSQLWAESYDQKLTDILGVEGHVAKQVAASLQVKLTGGEEQALAVKPTNNPEAYDAYLRGLIFETRNLSAAGQAPSGEAVGFYERAVLLDPNFAVAWARLSRGYAHMYLNRVDAADGANGEAAKHALENAQRLDPYSAETLLALGYYQSRVLGDYASARATFDRASKALPGSSEVREALALVVRREGHWDQSIVYFEQALALDPRNVQLLVDAASNYAEVRQFPPALNLYDRALDITPNDPELIGAKASVYHAQGNLQDAAKLLSEISWQTEGEATLQVMITQLKLERKYSEAVRLLQARLKLEYSSSMYKAVEQMLLASMQRLAGDTAGAKIIAQQARDTLEQLYRGQPDNGTISALLSQSYALIGEKESALKEAERATLWLGLDRVSRPQFEENLASIQMMFGDNTHAISTLTRLLLTPYLKGHIFCLTPPTVITPALLRLDPFWDPLRGDAAFQKLCDEKQPVAVK